MADRVTPPPRGSGDSGERRQASPRSGGVERRPASSRTGGYSERTQASRGSGSSERPQAPRSTSGERAQAARGAGGSQASRSSGYGERRPAAPRGGGSSGERRQSTRRMDVIRCENCGEDYSITYKRCPFCDERPGRGGISGKRVANTRGGGYGRPVNPIQIAGLVVSLALIASALFIVFRFVGAPIFGGKTGSNSSSSVSSSQSNKSSSSTGQPNVTPQAPQSIALNNTDFALDNGGTYQMVANLLPAGASGEVVWSSSDATVATVDATGLVTNVNAGSSDVKVTITATCGDLAAATAVTCKAKTGGGGGVGGGGSTAAVGSKGRIINAEKGLNIRSGPGKEYDVVASAQNGAQVTILGEENGFYKINYTGDKIGYVSKDYVSIG